METFPEVVMRVAWPTLRKYGYRVVRQDYRPEIFGNGFVDFRRRGVSVRIARDRSAVLVDIGVHQWLSVQWHDLTHFVNAVDPHAAFDYETTDPDTGRAIETEIQLGRVIEAMERYLVAILNGDLAILKEVKRVEKEYVDRRFGAFLAKGEDSPRR